MFLRSGDTFSTRTHSLTRQHSNNNENVRMPMKSLSVSKPSSLNSQATPAKSSSRPRRALGDISNKKASNGAGNKQDGTTSLVLKPRANTAFTPRSKSVASSSIPTSTTSYQHPFQSRIPSLGAKNITANKPPPLDTSSHAMRPRTTRSQTRQQATRIPSPTLTQQTRSKSGNIPIPQMPSKEESKIRPTKPTVEPTAAAPSVETVATVTTKPVETVDEVELPAGRMWIDQQNDDNYDDDFSTSSMDDILDGRTMWDDWRETMQRQLQDEVAESKRKEDELVQKQIQQVLKHDREQEKGLDCLVDWVEDLGLDPDSDPASLDALLEDDDWSDPASSIEGLGVAFEL